MIHSIEELFSKIDNHFFTPSKLERAIKFKAQKRQKESWFHDELLRLFTYLEDQKLISPEWDHEIRLSEALSHSDEEKTQEDIDFKVIINQHPMYLEVKTAYLGRQGKSSTFTPAFYLNSGQSSQSIARDVRKLKELSQIARCFCLVFVYASPFSEEVLQQVQKKPRGWTSWEDAMANFCRAMLPENITVNDITPSDTTRSEDLYIALLEVAPRSGKVNEG